MIATIDYHVTSECTQECPYCWGPQITENVCDTAAAAAIVRKISSTGAKRIVFTGGDPSMREDIGVLVRLAKQEGLEVALSATGDRLTYGFLRGYGKWIDLISIPIDGSTEEVSAKTKEAGHLSAVLAAFDILKQFPEIDVKAATPVTRHNLHDVPAIIALLERVASKLKNRFFYNLFQTFPRSMTSREWDELVVSDEEFGALRDKIDVDSVSFTINWLTHETLDRLYVMVFPDGTLTVPSGGEYRSYGPFLDVRDLDALLLETEFDAEKHLRHARGWIKEA